MNKQTSEIVKSKDQIVKDELKRIVELLQTEEIPCLLKKAYLELDKQKPSSKWTFGNRFIMVMGGTSDARTFLQWKEVGRNVKKGEHAAIYPIRPNPYTIQKEVKDPKTGEIKKEPITLTSFVGFPTFAYEQTEGKSIFKNEPKQMPELTSVAEKWGLKIKYEESLAGEYGSYNGEEIRLCTPEASTFFHELAHAADDRIAKRENEKLVNGQDPAQEATAQLTACVIGSLYNMKLEGYTYQYLKHYSENHNHQSVGKLMFRVLARVERVLNEIFED